MGGGNLTRSLTHKTARWELVERAGVIEPPKLTDRQIRRKAARAAKAKPKVAAPNTDKL